MPKTGGARWRWCLRCGPVMLLHPCAVPSPSPLAAPQPPPPLVRSARKNNDNFEEGLLKLVRTLPKVLKYLPSDKAQDARNFVQSLQYWLGGNSENLQNFLLTIAGAYVPALQGVTFEVADPELFPEVGIWHPMATTMYEDLKEYLNW